MILSANKIAVISGGGSRIGRAVPLLQRRGGGYAYITRSSPDDWKYGTRKTLVLTHIDGPDKTRVSTPGYKSELVEYKNGCDSQTYLSPTPLGLVVSAVNGQRFYTNNRWPNAVVLKIENARFQQQTGPKTTQSAIDGAR